MRSSLPQSNLLNAIEISQQISWIDPRIAKACAGKFTADEWKVLSNSELPILIKNRLIDVMFIPSILEAIIVMKKLNPDFKKLVDTVITNIKLTLNQQQLPDISDVFEWLGPDLIKISEKQIDSDNMMDNIAHVLSDKMMRGIFSGDATALAQLTVIPASLAECGGKDVRPLLKEGKLSFKQLLKIASDIKSALQPSANQRQFPAFIGDNIELTGIAKQFTDKQLKIISEIISPFFLNNDMEKTALLRAILLSSNINNRNIMNELSDLQFRVYVCKIQTRFTKVMACGDQLTANISSDFNKMEIAGLQASTPLFDSMIRSYVGEYNSVHVIIPSEGILRQRALECAIRNAANAGRHIDVLLLVGVIDNINATAPKTGRTALHWAAAYAAKTGDRMCFDILMMDKKCDATIKDKDGKTALDLWDFTVLPDDSLFAMHEASKQTVQPSCFVN